MSNPEKAELKSMDVAEDKKRLLGQLFPETITESLSEDGKLFRAVDFEKLKAVLGAFSEVLEGQKERYGMTWPGKNECLKIIQQPSIATLKPCREESVNFDETENLFIEGDNLEVLKLLQKAYYGKVKMIYIDPPYNTGKEFIYPDKFAENLETYLAYTGQVDAEGRKFSTNTEAEGRFHSKWLNMMLPRLYLARNLLREDGAIFISIDEKEQTHLRALCNDVFGEENFVADMVWAAGRKNDSKYLSVSHEYIVAYVKNLDYLKSEGVLWRQRKEGLDDIYKAYDYLRKKFGQDHHAVQTELREWYSALPATHPARNHRHYSCVDQRGIYFAADISWPGGGGPKYEVIHPITRKPCTVPSRGWMFPKPERMQEMIAENRVHFGPDETSVPCMKSYLQDKEEEVPFSVFYQDGRAATKRLRELLGGDYFENPKDEVVIRKIIEFASDSTAIILDFFSGSCTTAHAVLDLNKQDGGNRKFIMVQLPEPCDEKSEAYKAGYKTIADIGKERIRRVIKKLNEEEESELKLADHTPDRGFRAFKLDRSNFKVWDSEGAAKDSAALAKQLELHEQHILKGASPEDILYELLLKAGFPLTTKVEKQEMAGKEVFSIEGGTLLICLERELTKELIKAMADAAPSQVICLDEGFKGNDQLKANAVQTFKAHAQGKGKEAGIVFRTV